MEIMGNVGMEEIMEIMEMEEIMEIMKIMETMDFMKISIGGAEFQWVHGCPGWEKRTIRPPPSRGRPPLGA